MTAISGATVAAVSAGSAAACSACSGKMLKLLFTLVVLTSLLTPQPVISIQVLPDGGYSGIVIKISQDVPQENCADILQKIQVSYNIYTRTAGYSSYTTLESRIDVGKGINVGPGTFVKNSKRRASEFYIFYIKGGLI